MTGYRSKGTQGVGFPRDGDLPGRRIMSATGVIRPSGGESSGTHVVSASCSVSCVGGEVAVDAYGTPVAVDGFTDFSSLAAPVSFGYSPVTCSSTLAYDGGAYPGGYYTGASTIGLVLYVGVNKIVWGDGLDYVAVGLGSQQGRWLNYGFYAGRYNAGMDATNLLRGYGALIGSCPNPQAWGPPPYVVDKVGLFLRCVRVSVTLSCKLMFLREDA